MQTAVAHQTIRWPILLPPIAAAIAAGVLSGTVWCAVFLFVAWGVAFAVSKALIPGFGRGMGWVLSGAGALMIAGCGLNLYSWLLPPDASLSAPSLMYDYERDFRSAACYAATGRVNFWGSNSAYIQALGLAFRLTGVNILTPLCINLALSVGTISAGAWTAAYLLHRQASERTLTVAAFFIACVAQLTLLATVDLKDAGAVFSFTLMSGAIAVASRRHLPVRWLVGAAIAALLMVVFKSVLGVFVLAGAVLCVFRRGRGHIYDALFLALMAYAIVAAGNMFAVVPGSQHFSAESLSYGIFTECHKAYESIVMRGYYYRPIWERMCLIPITAGVQTLLPLPWHCVRDLQFGWFFPYGHFSWPWYALFGLVLSYVVLLMFRRGGGSLGRWTLFLMACYCGVALYGCGSSPRYFAPFIPMFAAPAIQALRVYRAGSAAVRHRFIITWGVYAVTLFGALMAAFALTN